MIFLSIAFACSIASSFNSRNMFRSLDFGVAICLEKARTFSTAESLPDWICFSFVFSVMLYLLFLLGMLCLGRLHNFEYCLLVAI